MSKFLSGVSAPFKGASFILARDELKKQTLFPIILTILVLFAGIFSGLYFSSDIISLAFGRWMAAGGGFVSTVLNIVGYLLITVFVFLFSYLFATIISVPFNSILAEKVLKILGILPPQRQGVAQHTSKFVKMLWASIIKSFVVTALAVVMFAGSFIPGVSLVVLFGGLMLLAFDCIDYSLEVLELTFKERVIFFRKHIAEISGFAVALGLIFLVPFVNFLLLPVAVAGGSILVGKNVKK